MGILHRLLALVLFVFVLLGTGMGLIPTAHAERYIAGPVEMCPNSQTELVPQEIPRFGGQFTVEVRSDNPDVATATYNPTSRTAMVTSGANDTNRAKTVRIYIVIQRQGLNPSVLEQEVRVKPQRQCNNNESVIDDVLPPIHWVDLRDFGIYHRICVNETKQLYLGGWGNTQDVSGVLAGTQARSSNTAVAEVTGQQFVSGQAGGDRLRITVLGKREGVARVTVTTAGVDMGGPFVEREENFLIDVVNCPPPAVQPANPPVGTVPSVPGTTPTPPANGGNGSSGTPEGEKEKKKDPKTTGEDHGAAPGVRETQKFLAHGLATSVFGTPYGNVVVHLPQDMAAGDKITGTVMLQPAGTTDQERLENAQALSRYTVEVESVTVVSDGPAEPFEVQLPSTAAGKTEMETSVVIKDDEQKPLQTTRFALPLLVQALAPGQGFQVPQTHEAGQPVQCQGRFDGSFNNTKLSVNGNELTKLAESPRSLVAVNPRETVGQNQEVVLLEGPNEIRTTMNVIPPRTMALTGPATSEEPKPEAATGGEAESPIKQAIQQMCDNTVTLYRQNLQAMVDQGWKAPKPPSKGTWTALLEYDITRTGGVENVRVTRSSGYAPIDESAKARVYQMQGQFRAFPSCYEKQTLPVTHTFKVIYR